MKRPIVVSLLLVISTLTYGAPEASGSVTDKEKTKKEEKEKAEDRKAAKEERMSRFKRLDKFKF